jgi:hypothetical protein
MAVSAGGRIVEATTLGTAGASLPEGLRDDGFEITELTRGPSNEGAISVVALSFFRPVTLPGRGDAKLLRLTVECEIPASGAPCREVAIAFRDGLKGSGLPVHNAVIFRGYARKDNGGAEDSDPDREEPGRVLSCSGVRFRRGDCNADRAINLSDAVFALNYLFTGGRTPPCRAACDTNDDGSIVITDPIYLLNFLFLGGPALRPPYPACGEDPSPGGIPCLEPGC